MTPRGSAGAGVNLQQYTPRPKLRPTSPGDIPLPALPGTWLPAFIWMPAAPGVMPTGPPPLMPMQFMPPPPAAPVPAQSKSDKIDKTALKSEDGSTKARIGGSTAAKTAKPKMDAKKRCHLLKDLKTLRRPLLLPK